MGTKTYHVFMGLTYSNKAKEYNHTRKNNDTEQLEKNIKKNHFTYLSPADGRGMSSAFS